MQDSSANALQAPTAVPASASAPAPSPPTSTPSNEDAAAAAAAGATSQEQQPAPAAPSAAPSPAVMPTAPSGMPPPSVQTAATTPTGAALQAQQPCAQDSALCTPITPHDPICGYLLQDPAFLAAVKRQDASQAAQAAAKTIKLNLHVIISRIKPQQNAALASFMAAGGGGGGGGTPLATNPSGSYGEAIGGGGPGMPAGYSGGPMMGAMPPGPAAAAAGPGPGIGAGMGEKRISDPDGRFKRGGSCEPLDLTGCGSGRVRELRRGDWVVIRSANKSTDPELLGHDAWVARVEHNGWVELQVPKLGRTVKLQQRYLQLIPPQHPMMLGPPVGHPSPHPSPSLGPAAAAGPPPLPPSAQAAAVSAVVAPPPPIGLPPPGGRRGTSETGGMGPPGMPYMDEQGRPYKRLQLDPSIRPALQLETLPPARVASTPGRGSTPRVKELVRAIRRDLLALEEAVPWNCVTPSWKNARPGWRRSLQRNVDVAAAAAATATTTATAMPTTPSAAAAAAAAAPPAPPPPPSSAAADAAATAAVAALVGATAASMLEIHDALMTEKIQGLFARRGAWETRLRELADGGNNYACLQVLWSEMAEGIKVWLAAGGAPPLTPGSGVGAVPGALSYSRSYDGGMATERGGDAYGAQPLSEDDYYVAAAATAQQQHQHPSMHHHHQQHLPSPFFDYASAVTAPTSGGGRSIGTATATATATTAVAAGRPPVTPWVMRSELTLLMQSLEAEVDTDLDEGPEATDVEEEGYGGRGDDSDAEPPSAAWRRRQRQRRRQQKQQSLPLDREREEQQQPAPPADADVATAATAPGAGEGQQQQQLGGRQATEVGPAVEEEVRQGRTDVPADTATSLVGGNPAVAGEAEGAPPAAATAAAPAAAAATATVAPMDLDLEAAATVPEAAGTPRTGTTP